MRNKNKQMGRAILLLSAVLFTVPLKAQVTIGAQTAPDNYSLLDLVTTNVKKGVHLPRMNTTERDALIPATTADSAAADGVAIYNTTTNCYDVWNGKKWLSLCDYTNNAPVITVQPRAFSWKELTTDAKFTGVTSPTNPAPLAIATISVTATGATSYQWYEFIRNGQDKVAAGTSNLATYTPDGNALGMKQYYCLVSNAFGSTKSDIAKVAVGCGAMTMEGGWRTFMCYNLGATITKIADQLSYTGNLYNSGFLGEVPATGYSGAAVDASVYGDLYQWGRIPDGHQLRSSLNSATNNAPSAGPYTPWNTSWPDGSDQIASGAPDYGKFVVNNLGSTGSGTYAPFDWNANPSGNNYNMWPDIGYANNDPCAHVSGVDGNIGWRMPNIYEWCAIWRGVMGAGSPSVSASVNTANTWVYIFAAPTTDNTTGTTGGFAISPDGVTTTLFLPSGGSRQWDSGQIGVVGIQGFYWTSTLRHIQPFSFHFGPGGIQTGSNSPRANGNSVRCIANI